VIRFGDPSDDCECGWSAEEEYEEGIKRLSRYYGEDYKRLVEDLGDPEAVSHYLRVLYDED
jgi:hypothetical protein